MGFGPGSFKYQLFGCFKVPERAFGRLLFHVLLEVTHLVTDKTERMVKREPLDVGGVFANVLAKAIELGENRFGFHAAIVGDSLTPP